MLEDSSPLTSLLPLVEDNSVHYSYLYMRLVHGTPVVVLRVSPHAQKSVNTIDIVKARRSQLNKTWSFSSRDLPWLVPTRGRYILPECSATQHGDIAKQTTTQTTNHQTRQSCSRHCWPVSMVTVCVIRSSQTERQMKLQLLLLSIKL